MENIMAFKRGQKENKYLTEIDADEIEAKSTPTDPYSEEKLSDITSVELPEPPKEPEKEAEVEPLLEPVAATPVAIPTTVTPRAPLAEKEIEMVKDLRTNQTGTIQIKVARPTDLREAPAVAESLIAGQTILLNLKDLPDTEGRRMIDYIAGVLFAIRGTIERPDDRTFLLTPYGVSVATEARIPE